MRKVTEFVTKNDITVLVGVSMGIFTAATVTCQLDSTSVICQFRLFDVNLLCMSYQ